MMVPPLALSCSTALKFFEARVAAAIEADRSTEAAMYRRWPPLARFSALAHRASLHKLLPDDYRDRITIARADGRTLAGLDLFGSNVSAGGAATIAGALLDGAEVTSINLRGNGLGD